MSDKAALDFAIRIIENYKLCILNSKEEIGIDLEKKGFCQGSIFKNALKDIEKKRKEE